MLIVHFRSKAEGASPHGVFQTSRRLNQKDFAALPHLCDTHLIFHENIWLRVPS